MRVSLMLGAAFYGVLLGAGEPNHQVVLEDFLSAHASPERLVQIQAEPKTIYWEAGRDAQELSFDFVLRGLSDRNLRLSFLKVAAYDSKDNLLCFRFLNRNAVGNPGIDSLGKTELKGRETLDLYNPFHRFPPDLKIARLRYMFTFYDPDARQEFYYGDIRVVPVHYRQKAKLSLPMKGVLVIMDGHDYYSHHRRFAMSLVREMTNGVFHKNFSRYALDFSVVGEDGNLRRMTEEEKTRNYDFHITDVKKFYTHGAPVYAPADGEVVSVVNELDDLYEQPFNLQVALDEERLADLAGNRVVIRHNDREYSHLFHFLKGSIEVKPGQKVSRGQLLGRIGFSGAANTYSHLHYQLLDGADFFEANALPASFDRVTLLQGGKSRFYPTLSINTADVILSR